MVRKIILFAMLLAGIVVPNASAQKIAVKSNLLDVAVGTLNLGMEFGLTPKWTLNVPLSVNPWRFGSGARYCHWGAQPEVRFWFSKGSTRFSQNFTRFNRAFVGGHLHFASYNFGNWPDWVVASDNMKQSRYQGYLFGGGISVGYSWILKRRWSIEVSTGLGYTRVHYEKYPCSECGSKLKESGKNYFGPTKASVSLLYMIK